MIYEITFYVNTPIITTTEIHFDSLLYAVSPVSHNKPEQLNRFTKEATLKDVPIPVDCIKIDNRYIYCCSTADFINAHKIVDTATKRREGLDFLYYHKQQTLKTGIDKNYMLKLYGISCECVKFLVSTSCCKELVRYCRRIKSIGGMRKQGYGEIKNFEIKELQNATWKDCIVSHNRALRNLPECFLENECENILRCKPPYWLLDNKENCAAVGEKAILRNDVYLSEFRR